MTTGGVWGCWDGFAEPALSFFSDASPSAIGTLSLPRTVPAQALGTSSSPADRTTSTLIFLDAIKPDVALNVLHGRPGEDGTIQGMLEVLGIPYTHSGVLASAVAMQKDRAKIMLREGGVPTPEGTVISRFEAAKSHSLSHNTPFDGWQMQGKVVATIVSGKVVYRVD